MNNKQMSRDFISRLEKAETGALEDFYLSLSPDIAKECGVKLVSDGSMLILIVSRSDVLAFNRCLGLGMERTVTKDDIKQIKRAFRDAGIKRFFIQLNPVITDNNIPELLYDSGFEHYNNWVKLYCDVRPLDGVKSDLRAEKIDYRQADDFARIVTTCFGWDKILEPWLASTVGRDNWHHYMAYQGEIPVATGAFYKFKDSAWVDFAATLNDYRGHGAQAILMQRRILDMASLGCHHIIVETAEQTPQKSAPSYRNMIRYGFTHAYTRPNYIFVFK